MIMIRVLITTIEVYLTISKYWVEQNISEVQESGAVGKKSGSETATKRPRNETSSPLPAFKVQ